MPADLARRPGHPGYQLLYRVEGPATEQINALLDVAIRVDPVPSDGEVLATIGSIVLTRVGPGQGGNELLSRLDGPDYPAGIDSAIWPDPESALAQSQVEAHAHSGTERSAGAHLRSAQPKTDERADGRESTHEPPSSSALSKPPPSRPHIALPDVISVLGLSRAAAAVANGEHVVVAVVDSQFTDDATDHQVGAIEDIPALLSGGAAAKIPQLGQHGHGDALVAVLKETLGALGASIRRVRIREDGLSGITAPADLAIAIAIAAAPQQNGSESLPADIVLIALSSGQWGMPHYLDMVIREAGRFGRGGKGTLIVCSTGHPGDNGLPVPMGDWRSSAHGADELGSHPDVLLVAPCDLDGHWLRRFDDIDRPPSGLLTSNVIAGRLGPSVRLAAPGVYTALSDGAIDESSLAATLIASVSALVLAANPAMSSFEVAKLLQQTAFRPDIVDVSDGPEANVFTGFDREGHNFKVGAGMVNPLGAVLSASDPVCRGLVRVSSAAAPLNRAPLTQAGLLIAYWFDSWIRSRPADDLTSGYLRFRLALTRYVSIAPAIDDELQWILRHLLAIFTYDGSNAWFSQTSGHDADHGALLRRVIRLLERVRQDVGRWAIAFDESAAVSEAAQTWIGKVTQRCRALDSAELEGFLTRALLGTEDDSEDDSSTGAPPVEAVGTAAAPRSASRPWHLLRRVEFLK